MAHGTLHIAHWALLIAYFGMNLARLRSLQVDPLLDDCSGALSNHYEPAAILLLPIQISMPNEQCPMSNVQSLDPEPER
jgi:hypothetical protein